MNTQVVVALIGSSAVAALVTAIVPPLVAELMSRLRARRWRKYYDGHPTASRATAEHRSKFDPPPENLPPIRVF